MNKKIRNATPLTYDGITFRSKLEAFTYKKLLEVGIRPEYENEKFEGHQLESINYVEDIIKNNGGLILENLDQIAEFLNNKC